MKEEMVSIRFDADGLEKIRYAAADAGMTLSEFIRHSSLAALPKPTLEIDSYFVPYGFAGPNGHAHYCRSCHGTTYGPSDPFQTFHMGGCPEWAKIKDAHATIPRVR